MTALTITASAPKNNPSVRFDPDSTESNNRIAKITRSCSSRPGVSVLAAPVPKSQFYTHDRAATLDQILGIAHEYVAIVVYWLRGWV